MATPPLRHDFVNPTAPASTELSADEYNLNAMRTDAAYDMATDSDLVAITGQSYAANDLPYATGSGTWAKTTLSAFARTLIDDASAAAMRTTLGVPAGSDTGIGPVTVSGTPSAGQVPIALTGTTASWQTDPKYTKPALGIPESDLTTGVQGKLNGIGSVAVSGTPTAGQIPTATSGTAATWQTPAAGGSGGGVPLSPTAVKTANYTAVAGDYVIANAANTFTVTMPTTPANGSLVGINTFGSGGTVTLSAGGSAELGRDTSAVTSLILASSTVAVPVSLWQYSTTGNYWYLIASNPSPVSTDIVDSTTVGRAVIVAATPAAGRAAIGLGAAQVTNVTSLTVDTDLYTYVENVGLTGAVTLNNPIGSGHRLSVAFTGTASRAISYGTAFESSTVTLPTTTSGTARLDIEFVKNSATSKWRCVRAV